LIRYPNKILVVINYIFAEHYLYIINHYCIF